MAYNVKFAFGSYANYSALTSKDNGTIYFITDKPAIYKGSTKMTCSDDFAAYTSASGDGGKMAAFLTGYLTGETTLAEIIAGLDSHILEQIDFTVATSADNKVLTGFEIEDGALKAGSITEITLADVATSGAAADVSIVDQGGLYDAATVEAALAEAMGKINANAQDAVVTVTKSTGGAGDDYVYRYTFSQGGTAITNGTIDIMKDMVATSGELVHPTPENPIIIDGQQVTSGTYIKMTIANGDPFYINVVDLIEYNSFTDSAEIDFTDNNHNISASIVDVNGNKITYKAAIDGVSERESVNAALTRIDGVLDDLAEDIDDAIDAKIADLDADVDASGTPAHSGTMVVSGITEVDGVITGVDSVEVEAAGAAAAAEQAAKSYTDDELAALDADLDASGASAGSGVTSASTVNAMSGVTQADGLLTGVDSVLVDAAGAAAAAENAAKGYADGLIAALDADVDAALSVTDTDANAVAVVSGVTEVDGVITAVDSVAVDQAGAATAAETAAKSYADGLIDALDASLDASGTAAHSGTFVVSGVNQVDGLLTSVDSVEVEAAGAAAAAETAAKAYTDTALTWVELGA